MKNNISIFLCLLFVLLGGSLKGQKLPKGFSYNAQVGFNGDWYRMNAQGGDVRARRPNQLIRFMAGGAVAYRGFAIPFQFMILDGKFNKSASINTPFPIDPSILDYITNPINSVGFSPSFKYGKVLLGTYNPRYSSFTSGDVRVFGGGSDIFYKKIRFAFHAGNSQNAVKTDIANGVAGGYARRVYSGKLGYGDEKDTHLHFNIMRSADKTSSFGTPLTTVAPQQNAVGSISFKLKLNDQFYTSGEWARSAFTADALVKTFETSSKVFGALMDFNSTSRLGSAVKGAIGYNQKQYGVELYTDYISEGFRSLGYPFLQPDQLNYRIQAKTTLLKEKMNLSGSIGQRVNNTANNQQTKSKQLTGSLNMDWQPSERFALVVAFSNFGVRNNTRNDTLRIENVTSSFSVSPSYTLPSTNLTHVFTAAFSLDAFTDLNLFTGSINSNNSKTLMGSYLTNFKNKPISFDITAMGFVNQLHDYGMRMSSLSAGGSYKLLDKKATLTAKVVLTQNAINDMDPSRQLLNRLGFQYNIVKRLNMGVSATINLFKFGGEMPGVRFQENLAQTTLIYTL